MEIVTKALYWISTGLLIPVIILLLIFFVQALILIGTFYSTYVHKLKFNKEFAPILNELNQANIHEKISANILHSKLLFVFYLRMITDKTQSALYREKAISDFEIATQKDLAKIQNLAKMGPVLGLMGTLIPMGPALVGLAAGDIASMASNMQVAFSTTVVGLLVGAIGFVIMQTKRLWYKNDLNNLEYIADLINEENTTVL